jgi:hypothetical protein
LSRGVYHRRVDANHGEIVKALRQCGASVLSLASVGHGCPDVAVGFQGKNYFLEIKDSSKVKSKQALTDLEMEFHVAWRGQVATVTSVEEALAVIRIEEVKA